MNRNMIHVTTLGICISLSFFILKPSFAEIPLGRFTDVKPVPGLEDIGFAKQSPFVTADELTIYFASNRPPGGDGNKSFFVATRNLASEPFGEPVEMDPPFIDNFSKLDVSLTFSKDGREAFFSSRIDSQGADPDLFMVTRKSALDDWSDPINLGPEINSLDWDAFPSLSNDELTLYFARMRDGDFDIYTTSRIKLNEPFGPAEPLAEINNRSEQNSPSISADGLALFLSTSADPRELSVATRSDVEEPFGRPTKLNRFGLGSEVNFRNAVEFTPFISPNWPADGSKLYYAAAFRPFTSNWDLYQATWRVALQAGDADQDFDFDQLDLVKVQAAGKYLTSTAATWGEGDWNGAPEGNVGSPPAGGGMFDQLDIVAALTANLYLTGSYEANQPRNQSEDTFVSVGYDATSGELWLEVPVGIELTSINVDSKSGILKGIRPATLDGTFDNLTESNLFKATFGGSFASTSFGNVARPGLSEQMLIDDLDVSGSSAGGGRLSGFQLIYIPEPTTAVLTLIGLLWIAFRFNRRTGVGRNIRGRNMM